MSGGQVRGAGSIKPAPRKKIPEKLFRGSKKNSIPHFFFFVIGAKIASSVPQNLISSTLDHCPAMRFIDTHTHIYCEEFTTDQASMLKRSRAAGVEAFCVPNVDCDTLPSMLAACNVHPDCHPMLGLHPTAVTNNYRSDLLSLKTHLNDPSFIAIGEIGLDLYWNSAFLSLQQEALSEQMTWALEYHLPVVIHLRQAFDALRSVFESFPSGGLPSGIIHCFSGSLAEAKYFLDRGFVLGVGGVITFKNNGELDEVIKAVPLSSVVLETDAPYLAPVPHRGKRNESSYLPLIAEKTAALKGCSVEQVAETTTLTAKNIFKLP